MRCSSDLMSQGQARHNAPPPYRHLRVSPPGSSRSVVLAAWLSGLAAYLPACSPIRVTTVVPAAYLYRG